MAVAPEAPRSTPARPAPASFGARVGAHIIDTLIAYGAAVTLFVVAGATADPWAVVAAIAGFAVLLLYQPVMTALTQGKTVGKMAVNARVEHADGSPIGAGRAFWRELIVKNVLSIFVLPWVISVLWVLRGPEHRALHDLMAETRVRKD